MVRRQKLNNAADDFFENTTKDWLPRPQPIDFVLDYFTNKEGGVFVDVGAYDGVSCSNTFVLENKMKWNGICVEPSLDAYKECEKNRSCPTFNLAISSQKKVFLRKVTGAASCLSCVIGVADHNHLNRIDQEINKSRGTYEDVTVDAITLDSLFNKLEKPKLIDYLSIDAEGSEYEILKTIDFNCFCIPLISIEYDHLKPRESDVLSLDILKKNGYTPIQQVCGDLFFSK